MRVLINAGPWLPVPPRGYGGIENIVATLVPELRRLGVEVVLATVGDSDIDVDERVAIYPSGQFAVLQRPYNQVCGVVPAHQHAVVRRLAEGDIDLVHDHVEAAGLMTLAALGPTAPPGLHTLHWDLQKHPELYGTFDGGGRVWVNGVSADQISRAPEALRAHAVAGLRPSYMLARLNDALLRQRAPGFVTAALARLGLHAIVEFDAVAPAEDGEIEAGPGHVHPELSPFGPPAAGRFAALGVRRLELNPSHRALDARLEDAERDREAHLLQERDRREHQHPERAGQDEPGGGDGGAGVLDAERRRLVRFLALAGLLPQPPDHQDVVVGADRHHEQVQDDR